MEEVLNSPASLKIMRHLHDNGYGIQDDMEYPMAFAALAKLDIMYLNQDMKEPDSKQFLDAM